jgi:hypothetical protein
MVDVEAIDINPGLQNRNPRESSRGFPQHIAVGGLQSDLQCCYPYYDDNPA